MLNITLRIFSGFLVTPSLNPSFHRDGEHVCMFYFILSPSLAASLYLVVMWEPEIDPTIHLPSPFYLFIEAVFLSLTQSS